MGGPGDAIPEERELTQELSAEVNASSAARDVAFERQTNRRIARRLVPFLFLLYIIAFVDRTNVAAAALEMPRDLGFSAKVIGFGSGIFFFGYMLLQIPGALIAERLSVRRWIASVMVAWGILTIAMSFIHTASEFYTVRFLVGVAEAGFFPAVVVYLTHWFRGADRAKALAGFYAAMPLSFVVGSPLAGLLLKISWFGVHGWRWLFVLEGVPAIAMGFVALNYLTDWPREAHWLRPQEREWIAGELEREKDAKKKLRPFGIAQALRDPNVILMMLCYFFATSGNYGIAFWLPTILKRLSGKSDLAVTVLAALPYLAGFVTQQINGWHSDRTQERRWHAALPVMLAGVSLFFAITFLSNVTLALLFFTMTAGFYYAFQPTFWTVPTEYLGGSAAAACVGLINTGNLGGFAGPFVLGFLQTKTHTFSAGLSYLVGSFILSGTLLVVAAGRARKP
ncbi:MAG TPA: MFS transporter [Candidatus Acidoferrales bacterium]|nr:MFS transporter [Candidatus Acidoferrales bacterium]